MQPERKRRGPARGYTCRAPEEGELPGVYDLIRACDLAEYGEPDLTVDELQADWMDPHTSWWVVASPSDELVGYGAVSRPERGEPEERPVPFDVECYVHPEHTGVGLGRLLLGLAEERAGRDLASSRREGRGGVLSNMVNGDNEAALRLLEREGYAPVRHFLRMRIDLQDMAPQPEPPTGTTVRPCRSGNEEHVAFATVEEAFRDHWDHEAGALAAWQRRRALAGAGPGLWLVAEVDGETVGAAFCDVSADRREGVVEWLAVRRPWRRGGNGLALLNAALGEIHARGGREAHLVVDAESPTGAARLYERAGMSTIRHYAVHHKRIGRSDGQMSGARNLPRPT